jgi:hypothetical protein
MQKKRSLGISSLEEEIVEAEVKRMLEPTYSTRPYSKIAVTGVVQDVTSTYVRMLWGVRSNRSGMMEDGLVHATEEGVPQGSSLSPLLSSVYLHYILVTCQDANSLSRTSCSNDTLLTFPPYGNISNFKTKSTVLVTSCQASCSQTQLSP